MEPELLYTINILYGATEVSIDTVDSIHDAVKIMDTMQIELERAAHSTRPFFKFINSDGEIHLIKAAKVDHVYMFTHMTDDDDGEKTKANEPTPTEPVSV